MTVATNVCTDCGAADMTVLVETRCGDRLCRRCWNETTRAPSANEPATPKLDFWIAAADHLAAETVSS